MKNKQNTKREEIETQIRELDSEVGKLSAEKIDQAQLLVGLRAKLQQIEERLEAKTAGGASLARQGACVNPGVNEANLSPAEREELNTARNAVKTAAAAFKQLETLIADKEHELADLLQEKSVIVCSSAADEVISFQAQVKQVKEEISTLQAAISRQREIISSAGNNASTDDSLIARRAEILADISIGKATLDDLDSIDRQIQESDRESLEARSQAKQAIANANQTITGLQTKLEKAESELKGLEARGTHVVHEFLISEAEKAGAEYLQAFNSLETSFRRLIAIDRIMTRRKYKGICLAKTDEILIPAFDLNSHAEKRGKIAFNKSELIMSSISGSGRHHNKVEDDAAAEINRWKKAGIAL